MKEYDVIGIGNPILDFTYNVKEEILSEIGLKKGSMQLVSNDQTKEIHKKLEKSSVKISPGGSCANTLSGIASLGGKVMFFGKVGDDKNGEIYEIKTKEDGVITSLSKHKEELTASAVTLITPDSERTFATFLGASVYFKKEDLINEEIKKAKILHLEGYQIANPELKKVIDHAVKIAKDNNIKISLDLSDAGVVKYNLLIFKEFVKNNVDILFANESEAFAFTGKKPKEAIDEIAKICSIAIVKTGSDGSLIKSKGKLHEISPYKTNLVNTNGAGDSYAAGFLYGLTKDYNIETSGKIASYVASLIVSKEEARYGKGLKEKVDNFFSL